jgi:hypothetical protein
VSMLVKIQEPTWSMHWRLKAATQL